MIAQLIIKHGGDIIYRDVETEDGEKINLSMAQFISYNLSEDDLQLKNPVYARILEEATEHSNEPGFNSEQYFTRHTDVELSNIATQMLMDVPLTKSLQIKKDKDALCNDVNHLLLDFRKNFMEEKLRQLKTEISKAMGDNDKLRQLMAEYADIQKRRNNMATLLGNNIVT